MKKVVVFSGAGVSADSGIATFRSSDGLWANYKIEDVCTPEALATNRPCVIEFYNIRRKELLEKSPNAGHYAIVDLERSGKFDVAVVTQNIDDLHERAGSANITHLHGELKKLRSSINENATVAIDGWQQKLDERHADGSLLRPFVVFFGESVPMFDVAAKIVSGADIFIIVGTSLAVYPAASLVNYVKNGAEIYLVDPATPQNSALTGSVTHIKAHSAVGLPQLVQQLIALG